MMGLRLPNLLAVESMKDERPAEIRWIGRRLKRHAGIDKFVCLIATLSVFIGGGCGSDTPPPNSVPASVSFPVIAKVEPQTPAALPVTAAPVAVAAETPAEKSPSAEQEPNPPEKPSDPRCEYQVSFSEDGRFAVSGGRNATVRLLDMNKGVLLRTFAGQRSAVSSVIFSPDASTIAAGSATGQIMLWSAGTADGLDETERQSLGSNERAPLGGHAGPVRCLAFRPDDQELASGGEDGTIRYWKLPIPLPETLWASATSVTIIESIPKTDMVIVGKKDGSLELWDLLELRTQPFAPSGSSAVTALAGSFDGKLAAAGDASGKLRVLDVAARRVIVDSVVHKGAITGVKFNPKLPQVVTVGADGMTRVVDLKLDFKTSERVLCKLRSKGRILALAHSGALAAAAAGGVIEVADLESGGLLHSLSVEGAEIISLTWSAGDHALVAGDSRGRLLSWRMPDGQRLFDCQSHQGSLLALAGDAVRPEIASGGADAKIHLWRQPGLPDVVAELGPGEVSKLAVSPNGNWVAVGKSDGSLQIVDAQKNSLVDDFPEVGKTISALAWSADNEWLAAGGIDGTVRVLRPAEGLQSQTLLNAGSAVAQLTFYPAGPTLIAATRSGELKAWKWPLQKTETLVGHTDSITALASNRAGSEFVTAGADRVCRVFDAASGNVLRVLEGPKKAISCLVQAGDDSWIAAGDMAGKISVWDGVTGNFVGSAPVGDSAITALASSPSNRLLASASADGRVHLWKMPLRPPLEMKDAPRASTAIAVSPSGKRLALGLADRSIVIRDTLSGEQTQTLLGHGGDIVSLAWSSDGTFLVSGSADQTVRLWRVADGNCSAQWEGHPGPPPSVAISADNATLLACSADGRLAKYAHEARQEQILLRPRPGVATVGFSPNGKRLALALADGAVQLVDCESGKSIGKTASGDPVKALAWCADDSTWVSLGAKGQIKYWKLAAPDPRRGWIGAPPGLAKLAVSADGSRLLGALAQGAIRIWDATGQTIQEFTQTGAAEIQAVALADDGELAVAGAQDGRTHIFRASLVRVIKAHAGSAVALGFAGENSIVSAGDDQTICAWNVADGAQARKFEGCPTRAREMAVAPTASQLFVLGIDKKLYAWNLKDGTALPLKGRPGGAACRRIALNPDGKRLALLDEHDEVTVVQLPDMREIGSIASSAPNATAITFLKNGGIISAADKTAQIARDQPILFSHKAHEGTILGMAPVQNREEFLTAGVDGAIKLWSPDGKPLRELAQASGGARSFAMSSDAGQVFLLTSENQVKCWSYSGKEQGAWSAGSRLKSLEYFGRTTNNVLLSSETHFRLSQALSGKPLLTLAAQGKISASASGPNGGPLYAANDEGKLLRYALEPTLSSASGQGEVQSLAFAADGKTLASGGQDGSVCVWKIPSLEKICRLEGHAKPVIGVSFGRDESLVISASSDKTVRSWDVREAKATMSIPTPNAPDSLSVSGEGQIVAVALDDKNVAMFDLHSGKQLENVSKENGAVVNARFRGSELITLAADGRLCARDTPAGTAQFGRQSGPLSGVEVLNDGSYFVTAGAQTGIKLCGYNGQTLAEFETSNTPCTQISVSPDGVWLAGCNPSGPTPNVAPLWSTADRKQTSAITAPSPILAVKFEPEGGALLLVCEDRKLRRYRSGDGALLEEVLAVAGTSSTMTVTSYGEIVLLDADERARIYRPALRHVEQAHSGAVTSLAYSPNGGFLFSGGADGRIVCWDVEHWKASATYEANGGAVREIRLVPEQNTLVGAYTDNQVRVWRLDRKTGEPDAIFLHKAPVHCAWTSADGSLLATGGADKIVHLWNMATGRELVQFRGHEGDVECVSIAPDKKSLLSFGAEDAIRIWKVPDDVLATRADQPGGQPSIGQVNNPAKKLGVVQPQDSEIESLQRAVADLRSKNSTSAELGREVEEKERRLAALRAGDSVAGSNKPGHLFDRELQQIESRMRNIPQGPAKEKLRAEWRRLKRQMELEQRVAKASGAEQRAMQAEMDALASGATDPRDIKLDEESTGAIPGIEEKPTRTVRTDYVFDFRQFHPVKLALSRDFRTLAAARESAELANRLHVNGVVQLWDLDTGVQLRSWREVENHRVGSLVFSPNQQFAYTLPDVYLFDISSGASRPLANDARVAVSRDGTLAALGFASAVLAQQPILKFINTDSFSYRPQAVNGYESKVTAVTFGPDGKSIYLAIRERLRHRLVEIDTQTLTQKDEIIEEARHARPWHAGGAPGIEVLCVSSDEKYLVAYGRYEDEGIRLTCWTKDNGKWVVKHAFKNGAFGQLRNSDPERMWIVSDSSMLCFEDSRGLIRALDLSSGNFGSKDLATTHWGMPETAHSADGAWYVSGDDSGRLYLWDVRKGDIAWKFRAHSGPIVGVALSHDGGHIISAGEENLIKVWGRHDAEASSEVNGKPARKPRTPAAGKARAKN